MSVNAANPGTLFSGTWEQITGRFLLAAGGGYSAGATGGEATHKLTVAEMPSHTHTGKSEYGTVGSGNTIYASTYASSNIYTTNASGGNGAHNNMPPYLVVYVWKRTA